MIPEFQPDFAVVPLSKGFSMKVDCADLQFISAYHWFAKRHGGKEYWYATARINGKQVSLHRLLLGLGAGDRRLGDHKNGVTLDNRRLNLRATNHAGNSHNCRKQREAASKFKGVSAHKTRWKAQIRHLDRVLHLGVFRVEEDAARAYDEAARKLHGEFARLNFPEVA